MDSLNDIWQNILSQLGKSITSTSLNMWFSDCEPIDLAEKQFVIKTSTEFKRRQITSRYAAMIGAILSDIFSCEMTLLVLTAEEADEYQTQDSINDTLPEALAYTFDRFIVGKCNSFAHAAAMAVAENPGGTYNPLFIHGNSGLGKTHLLLAIGQAIREKNPNVKIGYVKGEDFANQMIRSIREQTTEEFRQRYRKVDLLLVDDIQFIAGKQAVQEEFFHTFNTIFEAGHQIVITSDRPPLEMNRLEDRLRTRFEGGLMADIQPPDLETRIAIIMNKSQGLGLMLPPDVINYIAETITSNVRQIEGVIHKLIAYSQLEHVINIDSVKRASNDVIRSGVYVPTPDEIIEETCRYFNVSEKDIRGEKRSKETALARQVAMYLMRNLTNLPLVDIGQHFNRNHSTVLSSIRKIEDLMQADRTFADDIRDITANINSQKS